MEQTIINCQKIIEEVRQIHILVNNAGLAFRLDKFQDYDLTDMMTMIHTNLKDTNCDTSVIATNR